LHSIFLIFEETPAMIKYILVIIVTFLSNLCIAQNQRGINLIKGSTVICIRTPDSIWLAADTKMVETTDQKVLKTRKLIAKDNIFCGFVGTMIIKNETSEIFNAYKILEKVIEKEKEFDKVCKVFSDSLDNQLNFILSVLILRKKIEILEYYTSHPILEYIILSNTQNFPYLRVQYVVKKEGENYKLENLKKTPIESSDINILGVKTHIEPFMENNLSYMHGFKNMKDKLVNLIGVEAKGSPQEVGLPADVLVIHKNGHQWYYDNYCK
jgi:hypothetical protein